MTMGLDMSYFCQQHLQKNEEDVEFTYHMNISRDILPCSLKSRVFKAFGVKFQIWFYPDYDKNAVGIFLHNSSDNPAHVVMEMDDPINGHSMDQIDDILEPAGIAYLFSINKNQDFVPRWCHFRFKFNKVTSLVSANKVIELKAENEKLVNDMNELKNRMLALEQRK